MHTLRQYLTALSDSRGLTRTLGEVELCRDAQGLPRYTVGNSAVVFRIRHQGQIRSLRCYTRPTRHLSEIYGAKHLPQELYLHTASDAGHWVDVVLGEWIEGDTLDQAIRTAVSKHDIEQLKSLSKAFNHLAAKLLAAPWAHGDLKPENIIVDPRGELLLIDFDAQYLPAFAGRQSPELGTAAYQHPTRTVADFDDSLDDYPAALISAALTALALNPTLLARYASADGLLFSPQNIHRDPALKEVLALFEREGCAIPYRLARLLTGPTLRLAGIETLFTALIQEPIPDDETPELFSEHGLWGFRTSERVVIPALYDSGFDFSEGLAAVQLGTTWHYIDSMGCAQLHLTDCEAIKPFRNGWAQIVRKGNRYQIDRSGREFDF